MPELIHPDHVHKPITFSKNKYAILPKTSHTTNFYAVHLYVDKPSTAPFGKGTGSICAVCKTGLHAGDVAIWSYSLVQNPEHVWARHLTCVGDETLSNVRAAGHAGEQVGGFASLAPNLQACVAQQCSTDAHSAWIALSVNGTRSVDLAGGEDAARVAEDYAKAEGVDRAERGPKKPRSAYVFYQSAEREALRAANRSLNSGEISTLLATQFKLLDDDEKKIYIDQAAQDKIRYEQECEAEGFDPAEAKKKKTKAKAKAKAGKKKVKKEEDDDDWE